MVCCCDFSTTMPVSLCEWRIRIGRFLPRTLSDDIKGCKHINHSKTMGKINKKSFSKVSQENQHKQENHEPKSSYNVRVLIVVTLLTLFCSLRLNGVVFPSITNIADSFDTRSVKTSIFNSPVWSIQSISASYDTYWLSPTFSLLTMLAVDKPSRLDSPLLIIQPVYYALYDNSWTTPTLMQLTSAGSSRLYYNVLAIHTISASYNYSSFGHSAVEMFSRLNFCCCTIQLVFTSYEGSSMTPSPVQSTADKPLRLNFHGAVTWSNSSGYASNEPSTFGLHMQQEAVSQQMSYFESCVSLKKGQGKCLWKLFISKIHHMRAGDIEVNPGPNSQTKTKGADVDSRTRTSTDFLSDKNIMDLAGQIPHEQLHELGIKLGLTYTKVNNSLDKHMKDTKKAATESLMAWKTKHGAGPEQAHALRNIFKEAGLSMHHLLTPDRLLLSPYRLEDCRDDQISPHFTVNKCRRLLAETYRSGICLVNRMPGDKRHDVCVKDIYTVVTIYKKDKVGNTRGEEDRVVLEGSLNGILTAEINGRLPNRIVIYAAAGKGKTTAVAKIANDWADQIKESPLNDLPLLFILRLRDIGNNQSLGDAIVKELLRGVEDLTPESLEKFIRRNPDLCHIILDGLDEYSGSILTKESECQSNILAILQNKDMTQSRVFVTTRPHLEKDFNQRELVNVYAKFEIEGFSPENVHKFLDDFFVDKPPSGRKLKAYLDNNDLLNELATTPLFCLMACRLSDHTPNLLLDIKTQSELFDAIFLYLWYQIKDKNERKFTLAWLTKTQRQLGKIALRGILDDSNKLFFTDDDFKQHPNTLDNGLILGIISESSTNAKPNPLLPNQMVARKFEYFHKAAQECLAGKYLSKRYTEKSTLSKKLAISKLDNVIKKKAQCIGDYGNLLRFAAGSDHETCLKVIKAIISSSYLEESERFRIIMDLSTEAHVSGILHRFIQTDTMVLTSPTLYTALGMKDLPDKLKKKITCIEIKSPSLTSNVPSRLGNGLQSFSNLQQVTITRPTIVTAMPPLTNVKCLKFLGLPRECGDWAWLLSAKNLKYIEVSVRRTEPSEGVDTIHVKEDTVTFSHTATPLTIDVLHNLPPHIKQKINEISIQDTELVEALSNKLWSCLKFFTSLTSLDIKRSSLSLPFSPPPLPTVQKLKTFVLNSDSYSSLIKSLSGLNTLSAWLCDGERDIDQIAAGLARGGGGKVTHISPSGYFADQHTVSAACMSRLIEAMRGRTNALQEIKLEWLRIDEESLVRLVDACRAVSTMRKIKILDCNVADNDRLIKHLNHLHQPQAQGAILVAVTGSGQFDIPHTHRLGAAS